MDHCPFLVPIAHPPLALLGPGTPSRPHHSGESPLLSRSGGKKGLRGSCAGTLGVPIGGTRRVGGILGVAGRLSGTVSPFRAEQGTSLDVEVAGPLGTPLGLAPEARRGSQGASRAAPGKSGPHEMVRLAHAFWPGTDGRSGQLGSGKPAGFASSLSRSFSRSEDTRLNSSHKHRSRMPSSA